MDKFTTFEKIMELLNEDSLLKSINETEADKWSKSFKTKEHLAVMIFAQLMSCRSLRETVVQFNGMLNKSLPIVRRSTISDANLHRSAAVFEQICNGLVKESKENITENLRVIDSTPIGVLGRGNKWVMEKATRNTKGLKVHISFTPNEEIIDQVVISHPNVNDITVAQSWDINPGTINIVDKGYCDYNWWHDIHSKKAYFVTRIKKNAAYKVIKENLYDGVISTSVLSDQIIVLKNKKPRGGKTNLLAGTPLRLVKFHDSIHNKTYDFITNLLSGSPDEIADFYKIRWEIELFFKWLKQHLKLKHFLGESENAIKIQIYVAIIAFILLQKLQKLAQKFSGIKFSRMRYFLAWVKIAINDHLFVRGTNVNNNTEPPFLLYWERGVCL